MSLAVIQEGRVQLRLNIVDTPGYGDLINNEGWWVDRCNRSLSIYQTDARLADFYSWDPIVKYIKDQHSAYLRKELTAMRERFIQDTRIHCCLYFLAPTGSTLKPIDVIVMKKLSEVVNVVPVIAKSDSLTLEERQRFKEHIRDELHYHQIRIYPFDTEDADPEEAQLNDAIRVRRF